MGPARPVHRPYRGVRWALLALGAVLLHPAAGFSALHSPQMAVPVGSEGQGGLLAKPAHGGPGMQLPSPHRGKKYQPPIVFPSKAEHSATLIFLHGWNSQGSGRGLELPQKLNLPWLKVWACLSARQSVHPRFVTRGSHNTSPQVVAPQAPMYRLTDGYEVQSWVDVSPGTLALSVAISLPQQGVALFDSVRRMVQEGALVSPESMISDIGLVGPYRRLQGDSTDRRSNAGHFQDLIKEEIALGIDPGRIFLAGYSQGGCTALSACASMDYKLGGCISLCSWFPQSLSAQEKLALRGMPALLCHGTADSYVPFELGVRAHGKCTDLGMQASFREYSGLGHEISDDITRDMRRFLLEHCPRQTPPNGQRVV